MGSGIEVLGAAARPHGSERPRRAQGRRTREQILAASVRVFGTGGAVAVTHRAVAEAAGVALGSTTYYFKDRQDLLRQTMAYARDVEEARLSAIAESFDGPLSIDTAVEMLAEMHLDKTVADPLYDLALFEMFMEATRNPDVRDETRRWSETIFGLTDRVLPPTDPALRRRDAVEIVASLIDGLMLEAVSNTQLSLGDLKDRLRVVVERLCAGT